MSDEGKHRWPENFGFQIYGDGPSYIVAVEKGSVADNSGLRPGDQLLQVNDRDVAGYSSSQIVDLAAKLAPATPGLGVASRLKEVTLTAPTSDIRMFGLTLKGPFPVIIDHVVQRSPAFYTNLKSGDVLIKIDEMIVSDIEQARSLLEDCVRVGGAQVGVISVKEISPRVTEQVAQKVERFEMPSEESETLYRTAGQQKAKDFLDNIKACLGDRTKDLQRFVAAIQNYSVDSDILLFIGQINQLLGDLPNRDELFANMRYFIPKHHKDAFDRIKAVQNNTGHTTFAAPQISLNDVPILVTCDCSLPSCCCSMALSNGSCNAFVQHDQGVNSYVQRIRSVKVPRGEKSFGLTLRGSQPIMIDDVERDSPSAQASLREGDEIIAINGISLINLPHAKAVALIQGSGSMPTLILQTTSGHLSQPVSAYHNASGYVAKAIVGDESVPCRSSMQRRKTYEDDQLIWASEYIPDTITFRGKTFRNQMEKLLHPDEQRTVKHALTEFYCNRQLDGLLYQLYPIIQGPDTSRHVIWHYVLSCLTEHERDALKRKLTELNQMPLTTDCGNSSSSDTVTGHKRRSDNNRAKAIKTSSQSANKNKNAAINLLSEPPAVMAKPQPHSKPYLLQTATLPSQSNSSATKRHRRRRTLGCDDVTSHCATSSDVASSQDALHNSSSGSGKTPYNRQVKSASDVMFTSSGVSTPGADAFGELQQQLARRRRRELSDARRRKSIGVAVAQQQQRNSPQLVDSDANADDGQALYARINLEGKRRGGRRRSLRKGVEVFTTTTTTTTTEETLIHSTQGDKDKKSSNKKKQQEVTPVIKETKAPKAETSTPPPVSPQPVSTPPVSSIDDIVFEEYLPPSKRLVDRDDDDSYIKSSASSKSRLRESEERDDYSRRRVPAVEEPIQTSSFVPVESSPQENRASSNGFNEPVTSSEMEPSNFNDFICDDQRKNGYLQSLKKKLTFSRPPKNADTDTFLRELNTQFDKEMKLVGDVKLLEEEQELKFGEKWSYLPKEDNGFSPTASTPTIAEVDEAVQNSFPASLPPPEELAPNYNHSNSVVTETATLDRRGVRRRRRRNVEGGRNAETLYETSEQQVKRISDPAPKPVEEEVIYDVPKPINTRRQPHINVDRRNNVVERRTRRSRTNPRPLSMSAKRNSTELKMHVWMQDDLGEAPHKNHAFEEARLRSHSPTNQVTLLDKAKKRNYRVSGISVDMEDIFSEAEEDLHTRRRQRGSQESILEQEQELADPDEIYAPLHEEVLALGLAYDEHEQDEEEEHPQTSSIGTQSIPSDIPPPPPMIPPPPPESFIPPPPPASAIPPPPPSLFQNTPVNSPARLAVKRINWEKIEPVDLGNTVWGQLDEDFETINDVVKYLDLEEHFATKKTSKFKPKKQIVSKDVVTLLPHKKAYNMSILLAHLKLSSDEIFNCLTINGSEMMRKRMDSAHFQQLLLYAPDKDEAAKILAFEGSPTVLNEADKLALKLVRIPGYELRLKALVFKHSFAEKEEEVRKNLETVQRASNQLRKSRKLAKILEFVLAMGNYMNRGHNRVAKATGFRIHFLADMDHTKTSDNKLTFMHILARAVLSKFPEVLTFGDELCDVAAAARIVYPAVLQELQELRRVWLHIRDHLLETASKNKQDRFKIAMETCLVRTNGSIKRLEQLHASTLKEFNKVAQYFGENPKNIGMQQFFNIFDKFIRKFEKSHGEIKKLVKAKSLNSR